METTPRTDIHASDIVEETQNRLHTAKHALTKQLVRIIAQICGWNAENKRDKHQKYTVLRVDKSNYISCSVT